MTIRTGEMNTNSTKKTDALITGIFLDLLNSNAVNTRAMGVQFDQVESTYFESPSNGDCTYFSTCSFETKMELEVHLREIVENKLKGIPEDVFGKLADLAFLLKEGHLEQVPDLSPFVYTLY